MKDKKEPIVDLNEGQMERTSKTYSEVLWGWAEGSQHISKVLIVLRCEDTQEISKSPVLIQARQMREVSAKVGGSLQMSMQKKHRFQKILVPAKDNQILLHWSTKKSNQFLGTQSREKHKIKSYKTFPTSQTNELNTNMHLMIQNIQIANRDYEISPNFRKIIIFFYVAFKIKNISQSWLSAS